jgi:two-component system, LytTR family, response regulator
MTYKAIIIDDEYLARSIIKKYIESIPDIEVVAEAENGFEGIKVIQKHQPDLIFLDIQMPKINGFEMLELIPEAPTTIFTTAFDAYALKAFETNAIDYLLKPFSEDRFKQSIDKWIKNISSTDPQLKNQKLNETSNKQPDEQNRIVIKEGTEIKIIPTSNVSHIEAYDDYVKIYTGEKYFLKKKTMNYFEQVLDPSVFIRIHRSFILNINELTKIESFEKNSYIAILKNKVRIPISRSAYPILKEKLGV